MGTTLRFGVIFRMILYYCQFNLFQAASQAAATAQVTYCVIALRNVVEISE